MLMTHHISGALLLALVSVWASGAQAQDKHMVFVGQYMAAFHVAKTCDKFKVVDPQKAADIAKNQDGLRRRKILTLLYYGKTVQLEAAGDATLKARGIDPGQTGQVCRFGQGIAEKNDVSGRFLTRN